MAAAARLRVQLHRINNLKDARPCVLTLPTPTTVVKKLLKTWRKTAKNKLKLKGKVDAVRLFVLSGGAEVTADTFERVVGGLEDGCSLVVSTGQTFEVDARLPAAGEDDAGPPARVDCIAEQSLVEADALKQLQGVAKNLGKVRHAVGMPDLHVGKGYPIGAAVASDGCFYPHLIGGDCGCGMLFVRTPMRSRNATSKKLGRWAASLQRMDELVDDDVVDGLLRRFEVDADVFARAGIRLDAFNVSLGTVGGGNHFAELQAVEQVVDEEAWARHDLAGAEASAFLLVHSGSRGLGRAVLDAYTKKHGTAALQKGSPEADSYLEQHEHALRWAKANRRLIATRFLDIIRGIDVDEQCKVELDIFHNFLEERDFADGPLFLHRKGAAPADRGLVVVPGSRGAFSYLVEPLSGNHEATEHAAFSLAHGAGRRLARGKARNSLKTRYPDPSVLRITDLGSHVVCGDKQLLLEESPESYKDIASVVEDLQAFGLIRIVAILRPLLTFKTP